MKNLILICLVVCYGLAMVDAFCIPFTRYPCRKSTPAEDSKEPKETPDDKEKERLNNEYNIDNIWFNFTLVYFFNPYKTVEISEREHFTQISKAFTPQHKTVMLIHGWQNAYGDEIWLEDYKKMVFELHQGNVNFFIIDWGTMAKNKYYYTSAAFTKVLGRQLASFIKFLYDEHQVDLDGIHLIGHSLGAHAAGFTGKSLEKLYDLRIGRITGLDPAGPGFQGAQGKEKKNRLDKSDAKLVEILHTNMGSSPLWGLGNIMKLGHFDLFLNGGSRQKGCYALVPEHNYDSYYPSTYKAPNVKDKTRINTMNFDDDAVDHRKELQSQPSWSSTFFCHHSRAADFYLEERDRESTCQRLAYACKSYKNFKSGLCSDCGRNGDKCRIFEYNPVEDIKVPKFTNHTFFLDTNAKAPFCAHHYALAIEIDESNFKSGTFELTLNGERDTETFELKGDWNNLDFNSLLVTDKELGRLVSASGKFKKGWYDRYYTKTIEFLSLSVKYMSNINPNIRESLSSKMIAHPSQNEVYHFEAYDEEEESYMMED